MLSPNARQCLYWLGVLGLATCASAEDLTLGFLYIQGSSSWVQESFSQFKLGIQDVNNDTTILPNDKLKFVLHNTEGMKGKALEGAISLVDQGVVGIVGTGYSSAVSFAGGYASLSKKPMISPGSTATNLIDKSTFPYVMRSIANDGGQLKALTATAGLFGWKRIAVLVSEIYEAGALQLMRPALEAEGIRYLILPYKNLIDGQQQIVPDHVAALQGTIRLVQSSGYKIIFGYLRSVDVPKINEMADAAGIGWDSKTHVWLITDASGWDTGGNKKANVLSVSTSQDATSRRKWFDARWKSVTTLYNQSIHGKYNTSSGLPFYGSAAQSNTVWDTDYAPVGDGKPDFWGSFVYDCVWLYAKAMHSLRVQGVSVHNGEKLKNELLKTRFEGITGEVFFDKKSQDRMSPIKILKGNPSGSPIVLGHATQDLANWDLSSGCGTTCTTIDVSKVQWEGGIGMTPTDGRTLDMVKTSVVYSDIVYPEGGSVQIKILARSSFQEPPCVDQCQSSNSSAACASCKQKEYDEISFSFVDADINVSVTPAVAPRRTVDLKSGKLSVVFLKGFKAAGTQDRSLRMAVGYKGKAFPGVHIIKLAPQGVCQPGQFGPGKGDCTPCAPGSFSAVAGLMSCIPCGAGKAAPTHGSTACVACAPGSYAAKAGTAECIPCPVGFYTSQSEQASCKPCGKGQVTMLLGSKTESDCGCAKGEFMAEGKECVKCTEGAICPGFKDAPLAKAGFYIHGNNLSTMKSLPTPLDVFECASEEVCPGQKDSQTSMCPGKREGIACGLCPDGYYESGSDCVECSSDGSAAIMPVVIVGFFFLSGAFIYMWSFQAEKVEVVESVLGSVTVGVMLAFLQTLGIFSRMTFGWPIGFKEILDFTALFAFELSFVRTPCSFPQSLASSYLASLLMPVFIVIAFSLWVPTSLLLNKVTRGKFLVFKVPVVKNSVGMVLQGLFISIVASVVSLLECKSNPNGKDTLRSQPYALCHDSEYWSVFPATIVGFIGVLGLLCYWTYLVVVAPKHFADRDFQMKTRFLVFKYHPCSWWWCIPLLFRSLGLALVTVVSPNDGYVQFFLMIGVLIAGLAGHLVYHPYSDRWANVLEAFELCCLITVLALGSWFIANSSEEDPSMAKALSVLLVVVLITSTVGLLSVFCFAFFLVFYPAKAKALRHSEVENCFGKLQTMLDVWQKVNREKDLIYKFIDTASYLDRQSICAISDLTTLELGTVQKKGLQRLSTRTLTRELEPEPKNSKCGSEKVSDDGGEKQELEPEMPQKDLEDEEETEI